MENKVKGIKLDHESRCKHYHSEVDVIAIRCGCCGDYYACYQCHEEVCGTPPEPLPRETFDEKNVLCGSCKHELTVNEYLQSNNRCPKCGTGFNPGCSRHYDLYFDLNV